MSDSVSETIKKVAVWIPRGTGTISALGSLAIICSLWSRNNSLSVPNFRFLFVLSIVDVINSLSLAVSSAAIPKGEYYGAIGNNATCSLQGFMVQFGTAVPYYNASICLFSYLTIIHKRTPENFSETFEPYCHALGILFPLLTAFVVLIDLWGSCV